MYISVGKGEKTPYTGSCQKLVEYLEKENKAADKQNFFFDQNSQHIKPDLVVSTIDSNIKKLGKQDAKYYMVTINPSEKELRHVQNDPDKLIAYARSVMEAYARAFERGIQGKDLVYFGKIEYGRKFTGAERAVQLGLVRPGSDKPGLNTHLHIIVSRKDKSQRLKLSPETNHRSKGQPFHGCFDKVKFFLACEHSFDQRFAYQRSLNERFAYGLAAQKERGTTPQRAVARAMVRATLEQTLQDRPSLLLWAQRLLQAGIRLSFDLKASEQARGVKYHLEQAPQAWLLRRAGRICLGRDAEGKPSLSYLLAREVPDKLAQRPISAQEKAQLISQGYTAYLAGFISRQGKPFGARLYFDLHNKLRFSFQHRIPLLAKHAPWTAQEIAQFQFPATYLGIELTPVLKKQLSLQQATELLPKLVANYPQDPSKASYTFTHEEIGTGWQLIDLQKHLSQQIQGATISQVEALLAPSHLDTQELTGTGARAVRRASALSSALDKPTSLEQALRKLLFTHPETDPADNRLSRLKRRKQKRSLAMQV